MRCCRRCRAYYEENAWRIRTRDSDERVMSRIIVCEYASGRHLGNTWTSWHSSVPDLFFAVVKHRQLHHHCDAYAIERVRVTWIESTMTSPQRCCTYAKTHSSLPGRRYGTASSATGIIENRTTSLCSGKLFQHSGLMTLMQECFCMIEDQNASLHANEMVR